MSGAERSPTVRIELELALGVEPISGRIAEPAGTPSDFSGWLQLAGALERIRTASEKSSVPSTVRSRRSSRRIGNPGNEAG